MIRPDPGLGEKNMMARRETLRKTLFCDPENGDSWRGAGNERGRIRIDISKINSQKSNGMFPNESQKRQLIRQKYFFAADSRSPRIIGCGSHIGMSILDFKKIYPQARILGFEPASSAEYEDIMIYAYRKPMN
jgi:hypothetical protein